MCHQCNDHKHFANVSARMGTKTKVMIAPYIGGRSTAVTAEMVVLVQSTYQENNEILTITMTIIRMTDAQMDLGLIV